MSATGEPRPDDEAGATLVEALVAVTVYALVAAVSFPLVARGVAAMAFEQAVSGLQADLRMARAQALRTGQEVDLVVDAEGRGYGWTPGPRRALVAGLTLAATQTASFYPDGSSSGDALLLANGRRQARFVVDADTGLARRLS